MKSQKNQDRIRSSPNNNAGKKCAAPGTPEIRKGILGVIMRYDVLILFFLLFFIYNTVPGVGIMSGDVIPATLLPVSILTHQNLYFDYYPSLVTHHDFSYAFPVVNGHYVSLFPIVTPVLITPVYGLSFLLSFLSGIPLELYEYLTLAKVSAAVVAALAGVLFYLVSKELFSQKVALVTTGIFALATSTWSISSQALWQHGMVELLLIALIYLIVRNEREKSTINILLLGIISGLFIFNRPPDSVLLIPVALYIFWLTRTKIAHYISGAVIGGLPFLLYNYTIFGNIFGGYSQNLKLFLLSPEFVVNYLGLLIAPNVGLLIFCPVLVLSVAGFIRLRQESTNKTRQVLILFGPAVALLILVYSFFSLWYSSAAYSYGPRFLTAAVPVLGLYTGFFLQDYLGHAVKNDPAQKRNLVLIVIAVLIAASVIIQSIGAFFFYYCPDKSMSSERAWDAGDSIIVESLFTGPGKATAIRIYTLPPLPPLLDYPLHPEPGGN